MKTVQIIFNIFRQKPAEEFFPLAEERDIGILARVPLASGLLSGKMTAERVFPADDHRSFNREGEAFDKGETFSGVPFEGASRPPRSSRSSSRRATPWRTWRCVGS